MVDVSRAQAFYEALGWRLDAGATFWDGHSGVFVDRDGHPWEVEHNPAWTLREDGSVVLDGVRP